MSENIYASMAGQSSHDRPLAPRPQAAELISDAVPAAANKRPAKRRRTACQRCRQSKLRCEASNGATRPCQRCSLNSWPCITDAESNHTRRRTTLNDLADHAEQLQAAASTTRTIINPIASPPASQTSSTRVPVSSANFAPSEVQQPHGSWSDGFNQSTPVAQAAAAGTSPTDSRRLEKTHDSVQSNLAAVAARTIETVTISPEQIEHFFNIYFSRYHTSFPVLSPPASPDEVYESSPLLFWTIIKTAARHDSFDFSLLPALVPALKRLLWLTIGTAPHMLPTLQAMSILCSWPFSASSMPTDITFILAGILKSAAMHTGLHRPDILTHYSRIRSSLGPAKLREAVKVWCCTYVAIEGVAAGNGQQPFFSSADCTIEQAYTASNPHGLPDLLHQAVFMQVFCNKVHSAMCDFDGLEGSASQPTRISLLKVLERDLRELEDRLDNQRSHRTSVNFLSACFQLRAYWLFEDVESSARREGVIKAFDTAIKLIDKIQSGETEGSPVRYLTFFTLRVCFVATVFISKVVHSSYGQYVDAERGKQAFNTGITIFKGCCVEDNDMNGRTTKILAQLWSIHMGLSERSQQPPGLSLKSRLLFSIAHDSLWQWREVYAGQPNNGAPSLPPPLMPPASTAIDAAGPSSSANHPPSSSALSPIQFEPGNGITQPPHTFDDDASLSAPSGQQFLSPLDFGDADPRRVTLPSVPEQDQFPRNMGLLPPNAMQCDILFPDTIMSYGADPEQSWLYSI